MKKYWGFLVSLVWMPVAWGSDLVYTPVNPSFGGNPINGSYLLSNAQSQNKHKAPDSGYTQRSSLDRFNDSLQYRLLNQLLADIGQDGNNSGLLSTDDFIVEISQDTDSGGLDITTTDKSTGEKTTITVDGLIAD